MADWTIETGRPGLRLRLSGELRIEVEYDPAFISDARLMAYSVPPARCDEPWGLDGARAAVPAHVLPVSEGAAERLRQAAEDEAAAEPIILSMKAAKENVVRSSTVRMDRAGRLYVTNGPTWRDNARKAWRRFRKWCRKARPW